MPTLKERKYPEPSTSARGSGNGANVARARELPQPEPQQRHQRQVSQQPAPQASRQAGDGQALEQQGVVDAMVEMQNHEADLGLPPGGPLQVEPWPPLLVGTGQRANPPSVLVQQLPPPPPPQQQQQQQQQPSRETLLLSIARMERCSRCHLRTWSFVQDPLTGALQTNALTIPNEVYNGRCLLCFPLPIGFAGAAAASSSVISNDDNGSDQGGRSAGRATGGTAGPENRGATETVATDSTAAAHPSDSARVDGPNNSLNRGSGITEEAQVLAEEEPEEDDSSRQERKSPYGAAEEDQTTLPAAAADKPIGDSIEQTNTVGRKRKNNSPQKKSQADDENDRGIKRRSLRSRSAPEPLSASAGAGKRKKSKKAKASAASKKELDAVENIRATIKELSKENGKTGSQIRCLKRLLSCVRVANTEKQESIVSHVVRLRGVECLLMLMRQSESIEVQVLICEILLYTLYFDSYKDVTVKLKVHNILKNALLSHPNEISLVTVLIGCLRYTTDNDSTVDREIIYDGCLDLVVDTAMRHRASPRIQLNTMLFLQDLTSELTDRSHIKRVLQSKALDCAVQAVRRNWKSEAIVSAGLAVITNVFQNQDEVNAFHKEVVAALEGLRSTLLRWIMKKSRPAGLVAVSLSCLCNISMEKGGVNNIIAESGLLVRAMEMMDDFDDSTEVQRCGCLFLASYSRGKGKMRANQVVEAGGIEAIVYCLDTFSDDAEVVAAALGALRNINHPANHSCSVSDVIDHLLKALKNHNDEEEVQEHGCLLLLQYIDFPLVVNKLKAKRIQSLLTKAAREYPDSCRQNVDRIKAKL